VVVVVGSEDEAPSGQPTVAEIRRRWSRFVLAFVILAVGVFGGWVARDRLSVDPTLVAVGNVSEFPVGSVTERSLDIGYFDLLPFEGSTPPSSAAARTSTGLFVNDPDEGILALSQRSPFLGCRVHPATAAQAEELGYDFPPGFAGGFLDPCHGGIFGLNGAHLAGPGVRGLDRFPVRYLADGTVAIDLTRLHATP
jgi:Rieske Fe-S protein